MAISFDRFPTHPAPDFRLNVDGRDITPLVDSRLQSVSLTECRGDEADQLDLSLLDHDGTLAIPRKGVIITLQFGWRGEPLVDKGSFVVDESEHSGAPDVVTVRARSADMVKELRIRREASYHKTTIGAVIGAIATRHGLNPRVDDRLAGIPLEHVDQTHESDLNFVSRLAKRFDAVGTVKAGHLLFLPINDTRSLGGEPMGTVHLTRADGDSHRYHTADRQAYSGVRAYWHNPGKAKRSGVLVGQSGNAKRLRETFATEADALAEAKAEWQRLQRGAATFELTLARGEPALSPQALVRVSGFKPEIDETEWLVKKSSHSLADGGYTTRVELETVGADGEEPNTAEEAD